MEVAAAGEALLPPSSCSPSGEFEALYQPNSTYCLKLHTFIILKFLWPGVAGLLLEGLSRCCKVYGGWRLSEQDLPPSWRDCW